MEKMTWKMLTLFMVICNRTSSCVAWEILLVISVSQLNVAGACRNPGEHAE